jgi:hypothetical protein
VRIGALPPSGDMAVRELGDLGLGLMHCQAIWSGASGSLRCKFPGSTRRSSSALVLASSIRGPSMTRGARPAWLPMAKALFRTDGR